MNEPNFIKPKASGPEVWMISLLATIIGIACLTATQLSVHEKRDCGAEQQEPQKDCSEKAPHPEFERNLGIYIYQYFSGTDQKDAYFRLLKNEHEVFRKSSSRARYNLMPIETVDLSRYGYQQNADNFIVRAKSKNSLLVVEEVNEVQDQRHYFVIDLDEPIKLLVELKSGSNQFVLRQPDRTGTFQLVGSDQLEAWGQQPVSPKVVFDLEENSQNHKFTLRLHKFSPRKKHELVRNSKNLQSLFANLCSAEEAPITFAPPELAAEMADLIYEGNSKQAKFLFDHSWPPHRQGKAQFEKAFKAELAKGQFSDQVAELNHP